jgi:hypothetical protein
MMKLNYILGCDEKMTFQTTTIEVVSSMRVIVQIFIQNHHGKDCGPFWRYEVPPDLGIALLVRVQSSLLSMSFSHAVTLVLNPSKCGKFNMRMLYDS